MQAEKLADFIYGALAPSEAREVLGLINSDPSWARAYYRELILESALMNVKEARPVAVTAWAGLLDGAMAVEKISPPVSPVVTETVWENALAKTSGKNAAVPVEANNVIAIKTNRYAYVAVAAAIVIFLGSFIFFNTGDKVVFQSLKPAVQTRTVEQNGTVQCAAKEKVAVRLNVHSRAVLEGATIIRVKENLPGRCVMEMEKGRAFFSVDKGVFREFRVSTPFGDAVVTGTAFEIDLSVSGGSLSVLEGGVTWAGERRASVSVAAGTTISLMDSERRETASLVPPGRLGTAGPAAGRGPVAADKGNEEGILERADGLKREGRFLDAIRAYQAVFDRGQGSHAAQAALFEMGSLRLQRMSDPAGARLDLEKYLGLYPAGEWREEARSMLIEISLKQHDYAVTAGHISRYLEEFPNSSRSADLLYRQATLYRVELADPDRAAAAYRGFLQKYPDDYRAEDARYWIEETAHAR